MANYEANSPEEGITNISTAVAIDRDKNSQFAVKWAVENLRLKEEKQVILVHVSTQQNLHPQDIEGLTSTQAELQQLFLPYRGFCARKGIRTKEVILYDLDISSALSEYISANSVKTIVLGATSRSAISRAFRNSTTDVPTSVGKAAPDFCSVYAISRGRTIKVKSANEFAANSSIPNNVSSADISEVSPKLICQDSWKSSGSEQCSLEGDGQQRGSPVNSGNNSRENQQTTPTERPSGSSTTSPRNSVSSNESLHMFPWEKRHGSKNPTLFESENTSLEFTPFGSNYNSLENSGASDTEFGNMTPPNRLPGGRTFALQQSVNYLNLRGRPLEGILPLSFSESSDHSEVQSFQSDLSYEILDHPLISDSSFSSTSTRAAELEDELKRMKLELKQIVTEYNAACQEVLTAREKVRDIAQWQSEEESKFVESKNAQETALAIVEREKQKCKAAVEIAKRAQWIAELEMEKRKLAEMIFKHESEEKQKAMDALARSVVRYRRYSINDIELATNYFSSSEKIGEGGYGPVYKGTVDHTPVAIKVLRSNISEGQKQFNREVEVLSRMRHPNMVILLGACPEYGCLVYEYMENGSLEDRLFCRNRTPPLPWGARFRIAAEIATALNFLHQTRPEPIVHRDLKPANILLDKNYVSKISDVGLSRLVPPSVADSITQYRMTAAAGTFCYIDPEYQKTGMLGTKSDIYSLGILLLQIVTAKDPMGLAHIVETAIETGRFAEVLDQTVRDWPVEEALSFAKLALKCCELRRRDRPDLDSIILPELQRLRDVGSQFKPEARFYYMYTQSQSYQESSSLSEVSSYYKQE